MTPRPSAFTWAEERYAAGERLAQAACDVSDALDRDYLFLSARLVACKDSIDAALAEYERTRDHP